jgi:transcriptional regulator with XRE-family HTH domain
VARPINSGDLGFAKRLVALRQKHGLSQAKLAAAFELNPSSIALYELGTNRPSLEQLIKLADFFAATTDALLGRVPRMTKKK